METMREKTIAALEKQIALLNRDDIGPAEKAAATQAVIALTQLLAVTETMI